MFKKSFALLLALIIVLSGCSPQAQKTEDEVKEIDVEDGVEQEITKQTEKEDTDEVDTKKDDNQKSKEDDKWALVEESLKDYRYNSFISFDEDFKLKKEGRDAVSERGIVSTQKYEASQIGADIIEKGGNAVDAAVASAFALGVCEPNASGLGGGGFMTMRIAETGEVIFIDFREVAPLNSAPDMYPLDEEGNVKDNLKARGGLSVAVPGEVKGLLYILEEYGTMSREEVLKPAIDLAENGFLATPKFLATATDAFDIMIKYPELGELYLDNGIPFEPGRIIKNPDLARTLRIISEKGVEGFYQGEVAQAIVDSANKYGGILTLDDFLNYEIEIREPVMGSYRGYTVYSSPPPSSGGAHLIQILNILENYDMSDIELYSAEHMHILSEAFKIVYADRAEYMGDPDYIDVPLIGIMSKEYAKQLSDKIDLDKSQEYEADDPWKYEGDKTTHLSVADKDGNMVGITKTINYYYGSGVVVDGYGFILNNEMDDFSPIPNEANSIAPGKKPLSSMSPTILLKDEEPFMILGAPGGSSIFAQVAQILVEVIDHDMDLQDAIDMPRIWDNLNNKIVYEDGIDESEINKLEEMGHETSHMINDTFGFVQAVLYKDGQLFGGADTWTDGKAVGY